MEISARGIRYILPHGVMTSLKTAWAIVNRESSAEILSKECRPNFESSAHSAMKFQVTHERFYFDDDSGDPSCAERLGFQEYEGSLDQAEFRRKFGDDEHSP